MLKPLTIDDIKSNMQIVGLPTFDCEECLTESYGPIIVLGNFEKKNGSLGYGFFCSSQCPL